MKKLLMVGLVFSAISASAGEMIKCEVTVVGGLTNVKKTSVELDVDSSQVGSGLEVEGDEGYIVSVAVRKVTNQTFTLEGHFIKKDERAIVASAFGKLPLSISMTMYNFKTNQKNLLGLTCGI